LFWKGVALAVSGDVAEARRTLDEVYGAGEGAGERWRELVRRLPAAGRLPDDPNLVAALTD
jgi:hypothetical protein